MESAKIFEVDGKCKIHVHAGRASRYCAPASQGPVPCVGGVEKAKCKCADAKNCIDCEFHSRRITGDAIVSVCTRCEKKTFSPNTSGQGGKRPA